jgi:hypothetical protein
VGTHHFFRIVTRIHLHPTRISKASRTSTIAPSYRYMLNCRVPFVRVRRLTIHVKRNIAILIRGRHASLCVEPTLNSVDKMLECEFTPSPGLGPFDFSAHCQSNSRRNRWNTHKAPMRLPVNGDQHPRNSQS